MKPLERRMARAHGEHYTDVALWKTATHLLDRGTREPTGSHHLLLAASLFAFLAFEAFLNEMGQRLAPQVWAEERKRFRGRRAGAVGKFKFLAKETGCACNWNRRPLKTVKDLAGIRDRLAHGRTERWDEVTSVEEVVADSSPPELEEWGTSVFAERAVRDIEGAADGWMETAKARHPGFALDRSSAFVGLSSQGRIDLLE
jgi:hypothetical protein